jgi:hypothetical protein
MSAKKHEVGKRYGSWLVVEDLGHEEGRSWVLCRCDCGNAAKIAATTLRSGKTQRCMRCRNARIPRHGGWGTPEYTTWTAMRARCRNPNRRVFRLYGGRGITVCERWDDYAAFIEDMGPRPSDKHTLERIDNDGGYSPENCRWALSAEQQSNKRTNRWIEFEGERRTLEQWALRLGIDPHALSSRIAHGWPLERALTAPSRGSTAAKVLEYGGRRLSTSAWARESGIPSRTLRRRLERGWSVERALTEPLGRQGRRQG